MKELITNSRMLINSVIKSAGQRLLVVILTVFNYGAAVIALLHMLLATKTLNNIL
jgi:hypothetical protein